MGAESWNSQSYPSLHLPPLTTDLHVALHGNQEIQDSPFPFSVFPADVDPANCTHSLVDNLKVDTSKAEKFSLTIYPFDKYGNAIATKTPFDVKAMLDEVAFWNDTVASGSKASIPIQQSATGAISIAMTLNGKHIKGSPHTIDAFIPMNAVLDADTVVTAVLGGGAFVFLSFAVYKAATKKGRENVMDEVTEARKCILPFVLDLVDIATDVGELGNQGFGRGD